MKLEDYIESVNKELNQIKEVISIIESNKGLFDKHNIEITIKINS